MTNKVADGMLLAVAGACLAAGGVFAHDITIREAPYVVTSNSTKSEHGWTKCQYCGTKLRYERTFKWNIPDNKWVETTNASAVPKACGKCKAKEQELARLEQEKRKLALDIEKEQAKQDVKQMRRIKSRLRNADK